MNYVEIKTYAKINLVLDCLYKRKDGFHEINSIMQSISLHDNLRLKKAKDISLTSNSSLIPLDERNFAFKAAQVVIDKYPFIEGLEIHIDKKIPVEAGLAGGSTNAAGVILGMNELFNLKMDSSQMIEIGEQIGSDVPFTILGGTALTKGRGTDVSPLAQTPFLWVVLLKPDFGVSTAQVYANMQQDMFVSGENTKKYKEALERKDKEYILNNLSNTLEKSTFALYPKLKEIKDFFLKNTQHSLMAGSGPTMFALFEEKTKAEDFKNSIPPEYGQRYLAYTIDREILNERVINDGENN